MSMKTDVDELLMSPELEGQLSDVEEQVAKLEESIPLCVLELDLKTGNPDDDIVVGTLVGISLGPVVEIDVRIPTEEAFRICMRWIKEEILPCAAYHINHGRQENRVDGPWIVSRARMTDFDPEKRSCTLGVDLKYLSTP
jgi:hypothetical protein